MTRSEDHGKFISSIAWCFYHPSLMHRQKIDEAPTPYRYMSESDQSEAESGSDGECLVKSNNDSEESTSHANFPTSGGRYGQNVLSDAWETIHAKLHYEKHLLEMREGSVFGEDTNSSVAVEEGYSDFGEPKASPRVTNKQSSGHHHHRFNDTSEMAHSNSPLGRSMAKRSIDPKERPHKACFATEATTSSNDHLFAGINGSISSGCGFGFSPERVESVESEAQRQQFLNKRAGHYNEFLVLKALRAKLQDDEDEED